MEKKVQEKRFTVQSEPKINIIEAQSRKGKKSWACLVLFKWVFTLFMFSATLFCLLASKLSLVSISQRLNDGNNRDNPVAFVMLMLIMMIPQFLAFLRSLASSAFSSKEYWPSKMAVFWVCFFNLSYLLLCVVRNYSLYYLTAFRAVFRTSQIWVIEIFATIVSSF